MTKRRIASEFDQIHNIFKLGSVSKATKGASGPWMDWIFQRGDIP
jgi:hypothetical protein